MASDQRNFVMTWILIDVILEIVCIQSIVWLNQYNGIIIKGESDGCKIYKYEKKILRTTQRKQQKMQQLRKHRQQKKLLPPQRKVLAVRQKELQII